MYELLLSTHAQRDLRRLSAALAARIIAAIRGLARNPRPRGSRKLAGSDRDYRLRIGDYRVIYEVDDAQHVVRVMYVRHRSDAYR